MTTPRSGAQAVGLAVLRCVAATHAGLGSTELAQRAGLSVSTAHTLAEDGLLIQDPKAERFQLGPALVVLGKSASATHRRYRCSRNWPRSPASPSTSASAPATTCASYWT